MCQSLYEGELFENESQIMEDFFHYLLLYYHAATSTSESLGQLLLSLLTPSRMSNSSWLTTQKIATNVNNLFRAVQYCVVTLPAIVILSSNDVLKALVL